MSRAIIFNPQHSVTLMDESPAGMQLSDTGSSVVFEQVFKAHFKSLHGYAGSIVKDEVAAEEMVQNVFMKLWEKKDQIQIQQSLTAYLYKAVYYESLNYLKHIKVREAHARYVAGSGNNETDAMDNAALKELQEKISNALNDLPEQCRTIFQLSRFEELKYRVIAEQMGLSVKTVESQMGKALRILRQKLADYLPVLLIVFINLKNIML